MYLCRLLVLKVIILPLCLASYNGTTRNNKEWRLIFHVFSFHFHGYDKSFAGSWGMLDGF